MQPGCAQSQAYGGGTLQPNGVIIYLLALQTTHGGLDLGALSCRSQTPGPRQKERWLGGPLGLSWQIG